MTWPMGTTTLALGGNAAVGIGPVELPVSLATREGDMVALVTAPENATATASVDIAGGKVSGATIHSDRAELPVQIVRDVRADRLTMTVLHEDAGGRRGEAGSRYDRQMRVFGEAGQAALGALHVGVVGAGGTGSAVAEQLARLGVGRLTIVDPDVVTLTNVTRIHESQDSDVGRPKVALAAELASSLGIATDARHGSISNRECAEALTTCDVVFGCTDDNAGRLVLARMAPRFSQLLIDVGVTVDVNAVGDVVGSPCRISVQPPGTTCIVCRGHVDPRAAAAELLDPGERESRADEGYVPGLGEPDPAVVSFTTLAASAAVSELLCRLFGFLLPRSGDLLIDPLSGRWTSLTRNAESIDGCAEEGVIGSGTLEPFLGLSW